MTAISTIYYLCATSRIGTLLIAKDDKGVCAVLIADSVNEVSQLLAERFPHAERNIIEGSPLGEAMSQLLTWLEQPNEPLALTLPLAPRGSRFQQQVWQALRQIRPGQRMSYSHLAEKLGKPGASRAVASACAANPLALVIPCHRIVRSDGSLSGYRWGVARKQLLLTLEQEATLLARA